MQGVKINKTHTDQAKRVESSWSAFSPWAARRGLGAGARIQRWALHGRALFSQGTGSRNSDTLGLLDGVSIALVVLLLLVKQIERQFHSVDLIDLSK
jgi:hypothetical protein